MNARRRSRRNRGKHTAKADQPVQQPPAKGEPSKKRRRRKAKPKAVDMQAFWGSSAELPAPPAEVPITNDATALVRSLGRIPLTGHETAAEHYMDPIYNRAVMLATALAAAGELAEPEELT